MKFLFLLAFLGSVAGADLIYNTSQSSWRQTVKKHINDIDDRADVLEALPANATSYTTEGTKALRVIKFNYSVSADGGSPGLKDLGVTIPAKSIIVRDYFFVESTLTPGTATISAQCEDDLNLLGTGTIPGGGATGHSFDGVASGAATAFVKNIGAACSINISIAAGSVTLTAGTLSGWVEYVEED